MPKACEPVPVREPVADGDPRVRDLGPRAPTRMARRRVSAGVTPVAWDPASGQWMVLLGMEHRENTTWRRGSGLWSDFGGHMNDTDRGHDVHTAGRECYEETLGFVDLRRDLVGNEYVLRAACAGPGGHKCVTYMVCLPYDESLPHRFANTRGVLWPLLVRERRMQQALRFFHDCNRHRTEEGGFPLMNDVIRAGRGRRGRVTRMPRLTYVAASNQATLTLGLRPMLRPGASDEATRHLRDVTQHDCDRYEQMWRDHAYLQEHVAQARGHPCVVVNASHNTVRVDQCYLEKEQVRWWPAAELMQALDHQSRTMERRFRSTYGALAMAVLEALGELKAPDETPESA